MKRIATSLSAALALVLLAGVASAALRVPQVPISDGQLQGYLNGVGENINVYTDQNAVQTWTTTVSNNATFTLMLELGAFAPANTIGLYNASLAAPPLYQVFPGAASPGWFATTSWRSGPTRVIVNLFDNNANLMGTTTYLGADASNFGLYLRSQSQISWTQDARNGVGEARALAYAGTGNNAGQWWLAFEDWIDYNFCDAVLFLESVNPTPVNSTSWGELKRRFR